jgi:unsaturated chondroitin disaccharide hydrolase
MKRRTRPEVWRISLVAGLVMTTGYYLTPFAQGQGMGCTDAALTLAEQQLTDTIAYLSTSQHARSTDPNNSNKWKSVSASDWTSGFFSGWQWYIYEKTLNGSWMTRAKAQTANLQSQDTNASNHDIGFKIFSSYGNGYRITRDPAYMSVIQTAAQTLASLYRPGAGVIESWPSYDSKITVIVDNMMNLELLFFAAQNGGDPNWYNMAVSHALKTIQNHVRADGGTYHVVDYNDDGTVYRKFTVQGAGNETTWSRGQAWGLYGFTMAYRYTKDARFLDAAQRLANYFINHLPPDYVPYWDFSVSGAEPRDSSSAAIAAAGLLELSTYAPAQTDKDRYYNAALNIQTSLSSTLYLGDRLATDGTVLHGTGSKPNGTEIDVSLIYGDYYFIQGCYRAKTPPPAPTGLTATPLSATQINLTWDALSGAVRYSVKRSTTPGGPYTMIAPPPVLTVHSYSDKSVSANTTYYYVVSALDVAGEGPDSTEASATTPLPDTTPPTVSITSPANGATVSGTVTVSASASDNVGVVGVRFKLDGANLGNEDTTAPYNVSWNTTTTPNGSHILTAIARDAAGNKTTSSTITLTISNSTGGQLSRFNPVADAYVRGGTYASQNFGTAFVLEEKNSNLDSYDRRTFLRFDLSSITGTSISQAALKLYVTSLVDGTAPIAVFAVPSNSWTETGITWNNQPAFGSLLVSTSLPTTGWTSFDVTSFVNSQLASDKKVSLMLWDSTQAMKLVRSNSRENSVNRPILEVTQ